MNTVLSNRMNPDLQSLLDEIDAEDGLLTEDQERRLEWLLANEKADVIDYGLAAKELAARIKLSHEWRDNQRAKESKWERVVERMRAAATQALIRLQSLGEPTRISDPAHSITISLVHNTKGRIELLGDISDVPETYRKVKLTETLDTEAVRADLDRGIPVPGVRLVVEDYVRLT